MFSTSIPNTEKKEGIVISTSRMLSEFQVSEHVWAVHSMLTHYVTQRLVEMTIPFLQYILYHP